MRPASFQGCAETRRSRQELHTHNLVIVTRRLHFLASPTQRYVATLCRRLESGVFGVRARWLERVPRVRKVRGVWIFPREGGEGCVTDVTKVGRVTDAGRKLPNRDGGQNTDMSIYIL